MINYNLWKLLQAYSSQFTRALLLAPTKELCLQISKHFEVRWWVADVLRLKHWERREKSAIQSQRTKLSIFQSWKFIKMMATSFLQQCNYTNWVILEVSAIWIKNLCEFQCGCSNVHCGNPSVQCYLQLALSILWGRAEFFVVLWWTGVVSISLQTVKCVAINQLTSSWSYEWFSLKTE